MTTTKERIEITAMADVRTTDEGITVALEMPGADPETLSVTVEDELLTVRADRPARLTDARVLLRETRAGVYTRTFRLSRDLSRDGIRADYRNGVLTLVVPRAEHTVPRRIEISVD